MQNMWKNLGKRFLEFIAINFFILFCKICCYLFYVITLFKKDKYDT